VNQVRVIIVDDERLARRTMRLHLTAHPEIEVVGEAASVEQALSLIRAAKPDAVFLDIQMPGKSGFDLLAMLEQPLNVIFVTAYAKHAIRAFEINALDYLLKPISQERLAVAVNRLLDGTLHDPKTDVESPLNQLVDTDIVWINTSHHGYFLPVENIIAIHAEGNYSRLIICCKKDSYVRRTLSEWEIILPSDRFIMLDRSLIINWQAVDHWTKTGRKMELYLQRCNQPLNLGRTASNRFRTMVIPLIEGRDD
jgi:two-component system, LytTR family, response regulator